MCSLLIVFGRFEWPSEGLGWVRLLQANLLIWADWLCWLEWLGGLDFPDEWKMALVMVLVEVERVKMAVVCPTADTEAHWNCCKETG